MVYSKYSKGGNKMKNLFDENGYNPKTGLFKSRYYARKQARGDEVTVKVEGGYKLMKIDQWYIWREQR
jgi:hypothetical protein